MHVISSTGRKKRNNFNYPTTAISIWRLRWATTGISLRSLA